MRAKDAVGQYGERVAVRHLVDAGFEIVDRNWRCGDGEIDVVAIDNGTLVFCEVKTRSSGAYGDPAEAVIGAKAARLRRLAVRWLAEQRNNAGPADGTAFWPQMRFDVVTVMRRGRGAAEVRHLRSAF